MIWCLAKLFFENGKILCRKVLSKEVKGFFSHCVLFWRNISILEDIIRPLFKVKIVFEFEVFYLI